MFYIICSCPTTSPFCTSPLFPFALYFRFLLTDDIKVSCDLFGAKAVGDFTDVVSRVFQAEIADCEAGQSPRPAGVSGKRPPILQPADGGVWVTGSDAGQLYAAPHLYLS